MNIDSIITAAQLCGNVFASLSALIETLHTVNASLVLSDGVGPADVSVLVPMAHVLLRLYTTVVMQLGLSQNAERADELLLV